MDSRKLSASCWKPPLTVSVNDSVELEVPNHTSHCKIIKGGPPKIKGNIDRIE